MKTKTGFTVAQHEAAGEALRNVHAELTSIFVAMSDLYPVTTGDSRKAYNSLKQAIQQVVRARSVMEEIYAQENPDTWQTSTYYGGSNAIQGLGGEASPVRTFEGGPRDGQRVNIPTDLHFKNEEVPIICAGGKVAIYADEGAIFRYLRTEDRSVA